MIKRLKWNVLYGDDEGLQSDTSASSNDSAEIGTTAAQQVLHQLAQNDPTLLVDKFTKSRAVDSGIAGATEESLLSSDSESAPASAPASAPVSASDSEGESEGLANGNGGAGMEEHVEEHVEEGEEDGEEDGEAEGEAEGEEEGGVKWRECELCPGRRFLNDLDVEAHLRSKGHGAAVARAERRSEKLASKKRAKQKGAVQSIDKGGLGGPSVSTARPSDGGKEGKGGKEGEGEGEGEADSKQKKKLRAKRKLKALKRRKWEAARQLAGGEAGTEEVKTSADSPASGATGDGGSKARRKRRKKMAKGQVESSAPS